MIDFLMNMSIWFGLILQQAIYIFLFCVVMLFVFYTVKQFPGGCTGDCNQGRRPCNCK